MLKNKDCLHFWGRFFLFFGALAGGQGLQIGLLKVLKIDSLSKNTPSSPSTFGPWGLSVFPRNYIDFYDVLYWMGCAVQWCSFLIKAHPIHDTHHCTAQPIHIIHNHKNQEDRAASGPLCQSPVIVIIIPLINMLDTVNHCSLPAGKTIQYPDRIRLFEKWLDQEKFLRLSREKVSYILIFLVMIIIILLWHMVYGTFCLFSFEYRSCCHNM